MTALVRGFARGARAARPGSVVLIAQANSSTEQADCDRITNRQIDRGSTVVFAAAGTCGLGALSAASLRGVWGVGSDADRAYLGSHILASTVQPVDRAVELAVRRFLQGSLPSGDVLLALDDDAVGISGISPDGSAGDPQEGRRRCRLAPGGRDGTAALNLAATQARFRSSGRNLMDAFVHRRGSFGSSIPARLHPLNHAGRRSRLQARA